MHPILLTGYDKNSFSAKRAGNGQQRREVAAGVPGRGPSLASPGRVDQVL